MIVEIPTVTPADNGGVGQTLHQRVSIARSDLVELERRTLDRVRTGAIVGGAAVLAGITIVDALRGEPGKEKLPGGDGTDALVPVFRVIRP
jgi:hypothetical protein